MTTKPETDVMAGVEPTALLRVARISGEVTGVFMPDQDPELCSETLRPLFASTQINEQFAKVMAEKDALLTEMQRELDEATEYRNQLRQQLAEAQAQLRLAASALERECERKDMPVNDTLWYDDCETLLDFMWSQDAGALDAAIAAAVGLYKRDAERYQFIFDNCSILLDGELLEDQAELDVAIASQKEQTK